MTLTQKTNNDIHIQGNIKTTDDYLSIKNAVNTQMAAGRNCVTFLIEDSLSMPSSIIGYFIKLIHHDKVTVNMLIGEVRLYELLEELNLVALFNARVTQLSPAVH